MAQTVVEALGALEGTPTVDGLGGEELIYASRDDLVFDSRVSEVAVALCADWTRLRSPEVATSFLLEAARHANPFGAPALFNVILDSKEALPAVAVELEEVLRVRSSGRGPVRDFALGAWTRLTLGGWARKKHALFAALEDSVDADDVTHALVRALGAALTWSQEKDLERALEFLLKDDELGSDASMELGMYAVSRAVACEDLTDVRDHLGTAHEFFAVAAKDDSRPDAVAFKSVIGGVLDQTHGQTVARSRYDAICETVYAYLDGYVGADPGWRAPRARTTVAWMGLLGDLQQADTDRWFSPVRTIASLARAMAAEKTKVLIVNVGSQRGVRTLVRPEVESIAARNADVITHIRRWLQLEDEDPDLRSAVEDLLRLLESSPPKGQGESISTAETTREDLIASAPGDIQALLDHFEALQMPLSYAEENLLARLLTECETHAEGGVERYSAELAVVLHRLVRYASLSLDRGQNSVRSSKWFALEEPWPKEHVLADDMNAALFGSGLNSSVERENAGGRVDIAVLFPRCRISIEVKRTVKRRDDDTLIADFGTQTIQYASTDVPVAILAVADYARRATRLDLPAVFQVVPKQLDPTSRQHALAAVRLQANVASPSTASSKSL
ncbi:hypothetical protein [Brevibacterium renqingii]|uniref:hypothetical protein n=1 Tax=Brevibacterium renqingii TaxID=2776916 RepID=UPI001AE0B688|nr:hypothetical protein [Brevibacterium renqingii]